MCKVATSIECASGDRSSMSTTGAESLVSGLEVGVFGAAGGGRGFDRVRAWPCRRPAPVVSPMSPTKRCECSIVAASLTHASACVCRLAARFSATFGDGVTTTVRLADWITACETLPIRSDAMPPSPREPSTMASASTSSASVRIVSATVPDRSRTVAAASIPRSRASVAPCCASCSARSRLARSSSCSSAGTLQRQADRTAQQSCWRHR